MKLHPNVSLAMRAGERGAAPSPTEVITSPPAIAARRDPFQRRILAALLRRSADCTKRHLQQRLHRIVARDLCGTK